MIGIIVAVVAALTPIDILGEMVSIGNAVRLRAGLWRGALSAQERPQRSARPVPYHPACRWWPILGIAFSLLLMGSCLGDLAASSS